ncbi:ABC transporter substrate-binding protein [Caenimonas soli]|uniref:ABC transporter substrate-binding protein n=1 Tax=Caenimonas soli TaxID=2735555 RepID=UPI0015519F4B|nr:ABC transporter substrate-binding protein [Caenimonas soli]NPC54809.1 ABC transporter substrate-binding protein [Caenimonas soli]
MSRTPGFSRRLMLQAGAGAAAAVALPRWAHASVEPIRIGRTAATSGPFSYPYLEMNKGIAAAFEEVNAKGGIERRKLEMIALDDQGSAAKAVENAKLLLERDKVFAFLGCGPTQTVLAMLPLLAQTRVPLIAPGTGLDALRAEYNPLTIYTRPTYGAEIAKIARQLAVVGQNKCAVVYSDNAFGKSTFAAFDAAAKKEGNTEWKGFMLTDKPEETGKLVEQIAAWGPSSYLSASVATHGVPFFRALRSRIKAPAYTFSLLGSKPILDAVGDHSRGLVVSQVVPNPDNITIRVVKEYQAAMKKTDGGEPNYSSLEGYIAARVLIEGLRRAKGTTDRERFLQAFLTMRPYDMGGFDVAFASGDNTGSDFVELTHYTGERFRR